MLSQEMRIITSSASPMILLMGLLYIVLADLFIKKSQKKLLCAAIALITTRIAKDVLEYVFHYFSPSKVARMILATYGYLLLPILIMVFYYLILVNKNRKLYIPAWCLIGVNSLVYLINPFTEIAFHFDDKISFYRRPLGFTSHVISVILFIGLFILAIRERKRRRLFALVPFSMFFIAGSAAFDLFIPENIYLSVSFFSTALVVCCVMTYMWLHMQLVEEHRDNVMAQQRIKIMVSQIQPHFIFNTIATFKALCRTDPEKAAEVAEKFGVYLRQNLDSLDTVELIPIAKELEHTRIYADIEMVRFENVRVEYDIDDSGFSLPPLSVQPIVENAIRHGVRNKKEGLVSISTRYDDGVHVVTVRDNGVGFDPGAAEGPENGHIGISNVRERIEQMCGGTMEIESRPGEGTAVTLRIPGK